MKRLFPVVVKSSFILTMLLGFVWNICQLVAWFEWHSPASMIVVEAIVAAYFVYFYFLSSLTTISALAFIHDYFLFDKQKK